MIKRASRKNVLDAARRATVRVCDENGQHRGQGLLLDLEGEGTVVLTCHHVVATLQMGHLFVAIPQPDGELGRPVSADYLEQRSRPAMDAVVLGVSPKHKPTLFPKR
jgi:hypothetical protein